MWPRRQKTSTPTRREPTVRAVPAVNIWGPPATLYLVRNAGLRRAGVYLATSPYMAALIALDDWNVDRHRPYAHIFHATAATPIGGGAG